MLIIWKSYNFLINLNNFYFDHRMVIAPMKIFRNLVGSIINKTFPISCWFMKIDYDINEKNI